MELDYCVPLGLPHSRFKNWDRDDQELALAWTLLKASVCPRCGTMSHEWLDDEGRMVDPPPYDLKAHKCIGCEIMEDERKKVPPSESAGLNLYYERPKKQWPRNSKKDPRKNK